VAGAGTLAPAFAGDSLRHCSLSTFMCNATLP
jgi:hypothetical protein